MELAGCRVRRLLSRRNDDVSRSTSLHDDERTDSRVSDSESDDDASLASDEEEFFNTSGSRSVIRTVACRTTNAYNTAHTSNCFLRGLYRTDLENKRYRNKNFKFSDNIL